MIKNVVKIHVDLLMGLIYLQLVSLGKFVSNTITALAATLVSVVIVITQNANVFAILNTWDLIVNTTSAKGNFNLK